MFGKERRMCLEESKGEFFNRGRHFISLAFMLHKQSFSALIPFPDNCRSSKVLDNTFGSNAKTEANTSSNRTQTEGHKDFIALAVATDISPPGICNIPRSTFT